MRKLALALATTAILGMAAPAFAIESGTAAQTRTSVAQANVKAKKTHVNATAKVAHHRRGMTTAKVAPHRHGVNKLVHDRGLHRGYYAYAKPHHKSVRAAQAPVAH
jgi:hypothetical protein